MAYFQTSLLIIVALVGANVYANCGLIEEDVERLTCYDKSNAGKNTTDLEPLEARLKSDDTAEERRFSIASHKPNYLLPFSYNVNSDYREYDTIGNTFSNTEIKFQLSIKAAVFRGLWHNSNVWVAYTQKSFWQLYADTEASSPFRETNHEPEIAWDIPMDVQLPGDISVKRAWLTFTHESNGRSKPLSRSWNRLSGMLIFEKKRFVLSAQSWIRLKEKPSNDDNPNIEDYVGRIESSIIYKGKHNTMALRVRNNLRDNNRSGAEFSLSRPMTSNFKWYIQAYLGYGENLIDMEIYNKRLSFGVALTDWL